MSTPQYPQCSRKNNKPPFQHPHLPTLDSSPASAKDHGKGLYCPRRLKHKLQQQQQQQEQQQYHSAYSEQPPANRCATPINATINSGSQEKIQGIILGILEFFRDDSGGCADLILENIAPQVATEVVRFFAALGNCGDSYYYPRSEETYTNLPRKRIEHFRYHYNPATQLLNIRGMPTKAHDCLSEFLSSFSFTMQLMQSNVFTSQEMSSIKPWLSNVALPGSAKRRRHGMNIKNPKLGAREKLADYALVFVDSHEEGDDEVFPHVIFEVGYSQKYYSGDQYQGADLMSDMTEWMSSSEGSVNMVVLVKIEESPLPGKPWGRLEGQEDLDADVDDEEIPNVLSDSDSDADDYRAIMKSIKNEVDEWVGKLTVFIECWVYSPHSAALELLVPTQYLLKDNILASPMATLPLSRSTFGLEPRKEGPDLAKLDLTEYAKKLLASRRQDALRRKARWIRKKRAQKKILLGERSGGWELC